MMLMMNDYSPINQLVVRLVKSQKIVRNAITVTQSPKWHLHNVLCLSQPQLFKKTIEINII